MKVRQVYWLILNGPCILDISKMQGPF